MSLPLSLTFGAPLVLWTLLTIPAAIAAYVLAQRRRARYAARFTNLDLLAAVAAEMPVWQRWQRHAPAALSLLAMAALLASLARPRAEIAIPKEQATVVMVMDVSGSMAAADVRPTRIDAARQAARSFLDTLPGPFKVSVVAFSDIVQTLVRPTTDRGAATTAINSLQAEGGTAMGDALQRAVDLIQASRLVATPAPPTPTPRATATPAATPAATPTASAPATPEATPAAILLLSDGANTAGRLSPLQAARAAQQLGIPIYTIALGTPDGTLEVPGVTLGRGRTLGRRIAVPPDPETLQQIARITGGQFFAAPTAGDLRAIYRDIGSRLGFEVERQDVTFAFAASGAILLAAAGATAFARAYRFP